MNLYEAMESRRSIRSYSSDSVPDEVLDRVLEAVRVAPSGSNSQPWRWVIVKDEKLKKDLAKACNGQMWIVEAPLVVVACGRNLGSNCGGYMGNLSMLVDLSIAFTHLVLAARAEGLGTCWIGAFSNDDVKKLLEIPEEWNVVAITPLGYPQQGETAFTEPGNRKPLNEIVSTDKF